MLKKERRKVLIRGSPLKIALLDTGYDENTPAFDLPGRLRKVKAWRDFTSCSPYPVNADGHGIYLLTLLLQVEYLVNIYVARVAESSKTLKLAEANIAEVIRVAALE